MALTTEQQNVYVAIWSKAVDTQMHFNEMSVKARQFGLAFVAAALGLGIVLLSRGEDFALPIPIGSGFDVHATVLIVLASAFALNAVRILDVNVYHKMLRGAVTFGEDFEENYMKQVFALEKGMTQTISHYSRYQDAGFNARNGKHAYTGKVKKSAELKIRLFYNSSIGTLVVLAAVLFFVTAHFGHPTGGQTRTPQSSSPVAPTVSAPVTPTENSPVAPALNPNAK
jgi:hypothetical protein